MDNSTGLTNSEVLQARRKFGENSIYQKKTHALNIFINQIRQNPLVIVLTLATIISFLVGEKISSIYIFVMLFASLFLGFYNEYNAQKVIQKLLKQISHMTMVLRNGKKERLDVDELVVGDTIFLYPGDIVPADCKIIQTKNLEIDESALTGESLSQEKKENQEVLMGTIVISGSAQCIVTKVGQETNFGKIVKEASFAKPQTQFQKGLTSFGQFLTKLILISTVAIFVINLLLGKTLLISLLFALAIAIGLTPELMPVIVTISLAHGAGKLAKKKVIAKQLVSIENLGNMDVLATDKTGTLTRGKVQLIGHTTFDSKFDPIELSLLTIQQEVIQVHNINPIEAAIYEYAKIQNIDVDQNKDVMFQKPFDYNHKASFAVVKSKPGWGYLIAKGAPQDIFTHCASTTKLHTQEFDRLSKDGVRVIAVAHKKIKLKATYSWKDMQGIQLVGFLKFMDIPKSGVIHALKKLRQLNVDIKVLTGDNEIITKRICKEVGLTIENKILTGEDIEVLSDSEVSQILETTNVFAHLNPNHKLRIINLLKASGKTVGYLGDGINDIPSLHSADVGISVDDGVDVAKDEADIVLLEKDLNVLAEGITEGRITFTNTIKYIFMSISSSFGNMFSASVSSFVLPFLPMTPAQILLNDGLYDISQTSIASDNVDLETIRKPRHWNIESIKNFMFFFGPISSIYDFITFGVMYFLFHARGPLFQTGWFIESLATQLLVVFVIRTNITPFFKSRPSKTLLIMNLSLVLVGVSLPFTILGQSLGFVPLPPLYFLVLGFMVLSYLALVEFAKTIFFKKFSL